RTKPTAPNPPSNCRFLPENSPAKPIEEGKECPHCANELAEHFTGAVCESMTARVVDGGVRFEMDFGASGFIHFRADGALLTQGQGDAEPASSAFHEATKRYGDFASQAVK